MHNQVWVVGGMISYHKRSKFREVNPFYNVYSLGTDSRPKYDTSFKLLRPRTGHTCTSFGRNSMMVIGGIDSIRRFID
jgi:hypothetical protein